MIFSVETVFNLAETMLKLTETSKKVKFLEKLQKNQVFVGRICRFLKVSASFFFASDEIEK